MIGLAGRALTSWSETARLLTLATVLIVLLTLALWLLNVDIDVGPVHITHHSTATPTSR